MKKMDESQVYNRRIVDVLNGNVMTIKSMATDIGADEQSVRSFVKFRGRCTKHSDRIFEFLHKLDETITMDEVYNKESYSLIHNALNFLDSTENFEDIEYIPIEAVCDPVVYPDPNHMFVIEDIRRALRTLPERSQETIHMVFWEEMNNGELANELHVTRENARIRKDKILRKMFQDPRVRCLFATFMWYNHSDSMALFDPPVKTKRVYFEHSLFPNK